MAPHISSGICKERNAAAASYAAVEYVINQKTQEHSDHQPKAAHTRAKKPGAGAAAALLVLTCIFASAVTADTAFAELAIVFATGFGLEPSADTASFGTAATFLMAVTALANEFVGLVVLV